MNIQEMIENIIELALKEDGQDITSNAIFQEGESLAAVFMAKQEGIIAGLDVVNDVFAQVNKEISCRFAVSDGAVIHAGKHFGSVEGPAVDILKAERVALNFLQRMSGIATMTSRYVAMVHGTRARILDTRKTAPGHRILDKWAVRIGGGSNHRMGLSDMALIKDNHVDRAGSISEAVTRVRRSCPGVPLEVEARSLEHVRELLEIGVERIMLDNFTLKDLKSAVTMVDGAVPLEASGGITIDTVRDVALTGVDFISVGDITHSVKSLDISLIIKGLS
ncbi:MAG TPA: carboxylating nicotinate-nucleotide diphosphorylase [Deltaproteobacteria bacterium]|nr:carboxylating nicotinate-nucleotide diphosphorylase [Deltaproteobacteria bacterium]